MGRRHGLSVIGSNPIAPTISGRSSVVEQSPFAPCPSSFHRRACGDVQPQPQPGGRMANQMDGTEKSNFEITSKRRKGFPSETQVKRGVRIVRGNKELFEKLGRNDLCPCGSGRSF